MNFKKISLKTSDGIKIVAIQTIPSIKTDKIVILCHGITADKDESGILVRLADVLVHNGSSSFRFDFRGHGESGGKQEEMTLSGEMLDLTTVFIWVKKQGYKKIGLLGTSFAGGIASLFSSFYQDQISSLVLWNPSLDYSQYLYPKSPWKIKHFGEQKFAEALKRGYMEIGESKFKFGIKLFNEVRFLKPYEELKKFKKPVLFIHGDKDSYVPYRDSLKYSNLIGAKLITIKGAEHGFHDKKEWERETIGETVNFFKKTL
jgi:alpha-beta hydrolase superfamily lysophospholipase